MLVLTTPQHVPPSVSRHEPRLRRMHDDLRWPTTYVVPKARREAVTAWFECLAAHDAQLTDTPLHRELLGHLAAVALLSIDDRPDAPAPDDRLATLRAALERSFRVTRNVGDYAEALGCSAKTLDRLVRAVGGQSAKAFIDARVVLEAKRLLAHGDAPLETIAAELGFSEATNFGKFFSARCGSTPGAFRAGFR